MKKVPYFSKKKIIMAYKAGIRKGITSSKFFDNKDFVLEYIQEKYFDISDISKRLQNDHDIVLRWLKRYKKLPRNLPDICFKDTKLINFIIDNKKNDSFNFLESLSSSLQTKENILKSFGKSKDILKPKDHGYDLHINTNPSHPKNASLFEKFHIASWEPYSPPWHKIKKSKTYDDLELKKQALKVSPGAAYMLMLNKEISQEEYAEIFIETFLDSDHKPFPFDEVYCDSTPHDLKKRLGISQKEFILFESLILDTFFRKTKSIDLLCKFRSIYPCFNTISANKKIIENINLDLISDSQLAKIYYYHRYSEHSLSNPLHVLNFFYEESRYKRFSKIHFNNPKLAAHKIIYDIEKSYQFWKDFDHDRFLNSHKISRFYNNLDEKVKSSKTFLKEFIPILHLSNFFLDNLVRVFLDDIVKRTVEHIESNNDLNYLKKIIHHQSDSYFAYRTKIIPSNLFYFNVSNKLYTSEIVEYFLIRNSYFLSKDHIDCNINHLEISPEKRKHLLEIVNNKFYFKLVSKRGSACFEDNLIPIHLLDNKQFMIHSILKSYKTLKFASDRIKSYPSIIKIAYLKNKQSFNYISLTKKKNKRFIINFFSNQPVLAFIHAHHSIKIDKGIYLPALKADISLVSDLTSKQILKINLKLFNKSEREAIFHEFCNKMATDDIWELAMYKKRFNYQ